MTLALQLIKIRHSTNLIAFLSIPKFTNSYQIPCNATYYALNFRSNLSSLSYISKIRSKNKLDKVQSKNGLHLSIFQSMGIMSNDS